MRTTADNVIDALGGTSAVAQMTEAPVSTVHSWRKNGIPPSRLAHLKLVAQLHGKTDQLNEALSKPPEPAAAAA